MMSDKENIAENSAIGSNHARNISAENHYTEFDIDAIVDEMSIEDLRDLAKRILRVAKEKNNEKILSQLEFLINRQQHRKKSQLKDANASISSLLDPSHPDSILSLPPLLRNARSYESDDDKPVSLRPSAEMSPAINYSNKPQSEPDSPMTPMSPTRRTSNKEPKVDTLSMPNGDKSGDSQSWGKRQLVILCNRKPATGKESMDHDLAMTLCKNMGIIPSVIVSALSAENSTPTQEEQLLVEAMQSKASQEVADIPLNNIPVYKYPQFFVRSVHQHEEYAIIDYMGDYDTMENLYVTGKFDAESLEAIAASDEEVVGDSTLNSKKSEAILDRFIDQTSNSAPLRAGIASVGEPALPAPRVTTESRPLLSRSVSQNHLDNTNNSNGSITNTSDSYQSRNSSSNTSMESIQNTSQNGGSYCAENEAGAMSTTEESSGSAVPKITEADNDEPNSDFTAVPTILEEEDEDDDDDNETDESQEGDNGSTTVLRSGQIVKQEIVMLKSRSSKLRVEPPGAIVLNNHSSRLMSEERSSIQTPNFPPVKPTESNSKTIMNPYYALNYYSGGNGDDSALISGNNAVGIDKDPPGDDLASEQTIDPPENGASQREYLPWEKKFIGVGACYLIFHRNDDELNIHYSESPMENAVGVWTSPDIENFKESQGLSECELIGTCASRVTQEYKNFCQGWCQFIKAAKIMDGTVSAIDGLGLPVEFYLYDQGRTIKVVSRDGEAIFDTKIADAIACIPKGKLFPTPGIVGKKWGKLAKRLGGVALFKSLTIKKPDELEEEYQVSRDTISPPMVPDMPTPEPVPEPDPEPTLDTVEVVTPVPTAPKSLSSIINFETSPPISKAPIVANSLNPQPKQIPNVGACYLVYDPDSSGQLVEHYSTSPIEFAIGRWIPGTEKKIAGFKFKRNHGRNVLIRNCSGGVQGRKNFYSGWCQFVRSAKNMQGDITLWDTAVGRKGLNVDVCLYYDDNRPTHQTVRMEEGMTYTTKNMIAVACLPKGTPFFDSMTADLLLWLAEGSNHGYSSKM